MIDVALNEKTGQARNLQVDGKDKQLDYVFIDKSRSHCADAETNDMIHMGFDHRSVVEHSQFPHTK